MVTVEISEHDGQGFVVIERTRDLDDDEKKLRRCNGCGEVLIERDRLALTEKEARRLRAILNTFIKD